jgi:hypothetical protein
MGFMVKETKEDNGMGEWGIGSTIRDAIWTLRTMRLIVKMSGSMVITQVECSYLFQCY